MSRLDQEVILSSSDKLIQIRLLILRILFPNSELGRSFSSKICNKNIVWTRLSMIDSDR